MGSEQAYRELMNLYQPKVLSTVLSMVQDYAQAEDITQEVFVAVYRNIAQFDGRSALSTWLYRIAVNKCLDFLRSQKAKKNWGAIFKLGIESVEATPHFVHPGVLAENRENSIILHNAIKKLPENQRIAFILVYLEDIPQKDVAAIMELSLKAVESLLQRAKISLRRSIASRPSN